MCVYWWISGSASLSPYILDVLWMFTSSPDCTRVVCPCIRAMLVGPCRLGAFGGRPAAPLGGFKVYVLTSWCKRVQYPAPPPLPEAAPSSCNLCCEEWQQRATHKTFGKSAWFIFTRASRLPNYTGVSAHNVSLRHFIIYFTVCVVVVLFAWRWRERMEHGERSDWDLNGCSNEIKPYILGLFSIY